MTWDATLQELYGLAQHSVKPGLERIEALLSALDVEVPPAILVAGTNGKGTTVHLIADALTAAGVRTGRYTSPHVHRFTERITVDGAEIARARVARFVDDLDDLRERAGLADDPPTFFEVTTALALSHFEAEGCQAVVLEVGLGGRLDATNVVDPEVAVVTSIGLDHADVLGPGIEEIAHEKAGIVPEGGTCVTAAEGEALDVVRDRCRETGADLAVVDPSHVRVVERSLEGWTVALDGRPHRLGLRGDPHAVNLLLARRALSASPWEVDDATFRDAVQATHLPARFDVLAEGPVVADGGHNAEAARATAATWEALDLAAPRLVLGVLHDKDLDGMLDALLPLADEVAAVHRDPPRGMDGKALAEAVRGHGVEAAVHDGVASALEGREGPVLVTGSFLTAGDAIRLITDEPCDPLIAL